MPLGRLDRAVEYQGIGWGVHSVVMADGEYSTEGGGGLS